MSLIHSLFTSHVNLNYTGMTDWNSHILPGADNGIQSIRDSLEVLLTYEGLGINEVWLTPHIKPGTQYSTSELKTGLAILRAAYYGKIKLHLAAEYELDIQLSRILKSQEILPIGAAENTILINVSSFMERTCFENAINSIKAAGYIPLISHPECCGYADSLSMYKQWKSLGCKFMLSLLSIGGHYGAIAQKYAYELLSHNMYEYISTNIHDISELEYLKTIQLTKTIAEKIQILIDRNKY